MSEVNPLDMLLFGNTPDPRVAEEMRPLFARGTAALEAHIESLPVENQPLGGAKIAARQIRFVVTHDDFVANAALIFDHVVRNGALIHVLCGSGAVCAVFDRRNDKWSMIR